MLFPVLKGFFSRPQRSSLCTTSTSLPKPALSYQNLLVFERIQTQRLTPADDDMWTENRPRESARPCSFPVLKVFFFKVPEVFHVHNFHKPAKTSIIVPKPYNFLVGSDATFDIGGG